MDTLVEPMGQAEYFNEDGTGKPIGRLYISVFPCQYGTPGVTCTNNVPYDSILFMNRTWGASLNVNNYNNPVTWVNEPTTEAELSLTLARKEVIQAKMTILETDRGMVLSAIERKQFYNMVPTNAATTTRNLANIMPNYMVIGKATQSDVFYQARIEVTNWRY